MIFAREINAPLTSLVKKIDEATAKHSGNKMASFIVFLSDEEDLEKKLKDLAEKEKIEHTVLTIDNPSGPGNYRVAREADVTVVLYNRQTVKVNRAYKKGELKEKDIEEIVKDISKILPE